MAYIHPQPLSLIALAFSDSQSSNILREHTHFPSPLLQGTFNSFIIGPIAKHHFCLIQYALVCSSTGKVQG